MNDIPANDHGLTTEMQQSRWAHSLRYVPRERSLIDKVREHPATFFFCLGAMCAGIVLSVVIPACGGQW
jgi:hypothetical protein